MSGQECDVCRVGTTAGVFTGACGPISFAYCRECLEMRAQPFGALVMYFAITGTVSDSDIDSEYKSIVSATASRAGKSEDDFWRSVRFAIASLLDPIDSVIEV